MSISKEKHNRSKIPLFILLFVAICSLWSDHVQADSAVETATTVKQINAKDAPKSGEFNEPIHQTMRNPDGAGLKNSGDTFEPASNFVQAANNLACSNPENVSADGVAHQASVYTGSSLPASLATDGDLTSYTHTSERWPPASWHVVLNSNYLIDKIVLHNRHNCCGSRLRDITVFVLDQAGSTVFESSLLNPENELNSPAQITVDLPEAVLGRTVRIERTPDPDLSGNNGGGGPSEPHVLSLAEVEVLACPSPQGPEVNLHGDTISTDRFIEIFPTFSAEVTGLTESDLLVSNGVVKSLSGEGRYYVATIEATEPGLVEVSVAPDAATDPANGLTSSGSDIFSAVADFNLGDSWIIDEQSSWLAANGPSSNIAIQDGQIETTNTGMFRSIVRSFPTPQKADSITFKQSPAWDNWIGVGNIGPAEARNAPILLPIGNDDYYFLGQGSVGTPYHAWHSTDMVNWVDRGPISADGEPGRWVTSAEYKAGQFYIYTDTPNDLTPHLILDDNLDDGLVGVDKGAVLVKATCGSDASFFRNDTDGLFHAIYEDWSPINARLNEWDSPLAGHASSVDGVTGFGPHEHLPSVDQRTTPTGAVNTYEHARIGTCSYAEHLPAQDAYGDWTTIKIGDQYYLFSDFDPHDADDMQVARFTSDSIYKEFELVGSLGEGHPDPTVGFAEGQFYLITQQETDFISPGPWVDGVEARVGADIDGDQTIDQWTDWQSIQEEYDHKAGYARVVETTPAQVDLSDLPAAYGFQFEFKLDNSVVADTSPIMDSVTMQFTPTRAPIMMGDTNCDDRVNVIDALFIMQYEVEIRSDFNRCPLGNMATDIFTATGDVNNDETISVIDSLMIMQCEVDIANDFCP